MNNKLVNFRYGKPVIIPTEIDETFVPELEPGTFTVDAETLALYLDLDDKRIQIKDPLKLSTTGGTLTGDLIINYDGTTTCTIHANSGVIEGKFFDADAHIDIHMNTAAGKFATFDDDGHLKYRTKEEMLSDLGIGVLGLKDSASGIGTGSFVYTPTGRVTAPTVQVMPGFGKISDYVFPGQLPSYTVHGEVLKLDEGTETVVDEDAEVVLSIDSVTVEEPEFIGNSITQPITVNVTVS